MQSSALNCTAFHCDTSAALDTWFVASEVGLRCAADVAAAAVVTAAVPPSTPSAALCTRLCMGSASNTLSPPSVLARDLREWPALDPASEARPRAKGDADGASNGVGDGNNMSPE